jgi:hypothetical protein
MDRADQFRGGYHKYHSLCRMGLEDEGSFSALGEDWESMQMWRAKR